MPRTPSLSEDDAKRAMELLDKDGIPFPDVQAKMKVSRPTLRKAINEVDPKFFDRLKSAKSNNGQAKSPAKQTSEKKDTVSKAKPKAEAKESKKKSASKKKSSSKKKTTSKKTASKKKVSARNTTEVKPRKNSRKVTELGNSDLDSLLDLGLTANQLIVSVNGKIANIDSEIAALQVRKKELKDFVSK